MDSSLKTFRRARRVGIASSAFLLMVTTLAVADISEDRLRGLDKYLVSEAEKFNLPGVAVAVTSHGQIVHEKIQGPGVQSDSAFVIGSCSKTVTALATLIALKNTNTDVKTPVQDVLPRLKVLSPDGPLRILHLLQHRSGLVRSQGFDAFKVRS